MLSRPKKIRDGTVFVTGRVDDQAIRMSGPSPGLTADSPATASHRFAETPRWTVCSKLPTRPTRPRRAACSIAASPSASVRVTWRSWGSDGSR
jgi:hypothetical protein